MKTQVHFLTSAASTRGLNDFLQEVFIGTVPITKCLPWIQNKGPKLKCVHIPGQGLEEQV